MRSELHWLAALALGLVACGDTRDSAESYSDAESRTDLPDVAAGTEPDDTGVNVRDRDESTKTPLDQSNSERDLEITRQIRQKITDGDSFSTDAENVKVITENAVVTLRGPVETDQEKQAIAAIARETAGVVRVEDQLEVASR
jgi:hyperosmotically inducible protein